MNVLSSVSYIIYQIKTFDLFHTLCGNIKSVEEILRNKMLSIQYVICTILMKYVFRQEKLTTYQTNEIK